MKRYEELKVIGRGNYGTAILVRDRRSKGTKAVVKKIPLFALSEKERQDAQSECKLLATLHHPNIVEYLDSFLEDHALHLVTQYCELGDLSRLIKRNKKKGPDCFFKEKQIVDWFIQIAMAVDYIHSKNIMHRDLKTGNVFVTRTNVIKLGDFGIAKVLDSTMEHANTVVGTPYYMSPEVCENKQYNKKSDVWAMGCILYELCTLNHAFDASNLLGLVFKIVQESYPPIPGHYSPELRELLSLVLSKEPNSRPSCRRIFRFPFIKRRLTELAKSASLGRNPIHEAILGQRPDSAAPLTSQSKPDSTLGPEQQSGADFNHAPDEPSPTVAGKGTPSEQIRARKEVANRQREEELRSASKQAIRSRIQASRRSRTMFQPSLENHMFLGDEAETSPVNTTGPHDVPLRPLDLSIASEGSVVPPPPSCDSEFEPLSPPPPPPSKAQGSRDLPPTGLNSTTTSQSVGRAAAGNRKGIPPASGDFSNRHRVSKTAGQRRFRSSSGDVQDAHEVAFRGAVSRVSHSTPSAGPIGLSSTDRGSSAGLSDNSSFEESGSIARLDDRPIKSSGKYNIEDKTTPFRGGVLGENASGNCTPPRGDRKSGSARDSQGVPLVEDLCVHDDEYSDDFGSEAESGSAFLEEEEEEDKSGSQTSPPSKEYLAEARLADELDARNVIDECRRRVGVNGLRGSLEFPLNPSSTDKLQRKASSSSSLGRARSGSSLGSDTPRHMPDWGGIADHQRRRLCEELGVKLFQQVYQFLKRLHATNSGGAPRSKENQKLLRKMVGDKEKLRLCFDVDQLIYIEETYLM